MSLTASFNLAASVANRQLGRSEAAMTAALAKLSAGSRVVSARDDAASLAIGSRLNSEAQAMKQAAVNAGQASSMVQIADGAMGRIGDILIRMKTLAIQAGSGQLSNAERGMLDTEYVALRDEIDRIAGDTEFNGQRLVAYTGAVYTVRGMAQHGEVLLDGVAIGIGDSFTQADLEAGRVAYANNGDASPTDRLIVSVSDQDGNALGDVIGAGAASAFEDAEYRATGFLNFIHAADAYARAAAYGTNASGNGVVVAVIDSGVDLDHGQLTANLLAGTDIADGDGDANDDNAVAGGHGTHVAGIIAAANDGSGMQGVAFQADILPVKVMTTAGNGALSTADVTAAINYAVANGADIINLSLGGTSPDAAQNAAIAAAVNAGVIVIASTGNSNLTDPAWPAQFASDPDAEGTMLAVAANNYFDTIASFSNDAGVSREHAVSAYGVDILSTYNNGGYAIMSGTSMSAPMVSGAAAVLSSLFPNLTGQEVVNLLKTTARDVGAVGADSVFGYGIIDLRRATLPQIELDIGIGGGGTLNVGSGGSGGITTAFFDATTVYSNIVSPTARDFEIRVGSGILASDRIAFELSSVSAYNLGLHLSNVSTVSDTNAAITSIDTAMDRLVEARAGLGATLNRFDFAAAQIAVAFENIESARSQLLDLDVASEMATFVSKKVLIQVGVSMAAQSNLQGRNLMRLLQ
jgi:flagellin-like hook-associated protein FlgL